ncbi:hypothetical protein [Coleofasciculus sp. H7-2]|uniref:hypothetical protein n=1 Tax=Coleofasciculus sp. H7-2 TaxID=3351545 RepID=UPI0036710056
MDALFRFVKSVNPETSGLRIFVSCLKGYNKTLHYVNKILHNAIQRSRHLGRLRIGFLHTGRRVDGNFNPPKYYETVCKYLCSLNAIALKISNFGQLAP